MADYSLKQTFVQFSKKTLAWVKSNCVNNLVSDATNLPLAASQGKKLQDQITALNSNLSVNIINLTHVNENIDITRLKVTYTPQTKNVIFNGWITFNNQVEAGTQIFRLPYKNIFANPYYLIMIEYDDNYSFKVAEIVSNGNDVKINFNAKATSYCVCGCACIG